MNDTYIGVRRRVGPWVFVDLLPPQNVVSCKIDSSLNSGEIVNHEQRGCT